MSNEKYSFAGLVTVGSFIAIYILTGVVVTLIAFWPDMPEGLFRAVAVGGVWGAPFLLALFAVASKVRSGEIVGFFKVASRGEIKKESEYINPFPEEVKRYYKRWGIFGLVCFVFFHFVALATVFVDIIPPLHAVALDALLVGAFVGLGFWFKGDAKGVFLRPGNPKK